MTRKQPSTQGVQHEQTTHDGNAVPDSNRCNSSGCIAGLRSAHHHICDGGTMKQYRATQLESFRRYLAHDYVTHEDMIATLRGELVQNEAMRFGTAVHKALESKIINPEPMLHVDGYKLSPASIKLATELVMTVGASTEVTFIRDWSFDIGDVELRGTCDVVQGREVMDYKTTFNSIDDAKLRSYEDSYQWRAYLALTGCDTFTYNIMQWKEEGGIWYIAKQQYVTCHRYTGIIDDVGIMLHGLHEFAINNKVML